MNIFQHLEKIDECIKNIKRDNLEDIFSSEDISDLGIGLNSSVPWSQNTSWAMQNDFDHDGIPDALDNFFGTGAFK